MHGLSSLIRAASAAVAVGLVALGVGSGDARAQDFKLRLSHPLTTGDQAHVAMVYFADNVKKRSNGKIDITVFPADQMGRQKDVGEMVRQGANVIQLTDALFLGEWVPDAAILQAPYLMEKPEDFRKILGTEWLEDVNKQLAAKGVRVLSWNNYFGTRQIMSRKPIRSLADLSGANFRAAAAPMYVQTVAAMGAKPVTTGFAEVYTGLAQGALDMLEAPLPTMWASKFYEQAKFVTLTAHMIAWDPVIMSETYFKAMPADVQKMLLEESSRAADHMTKLKLEEEEDMVRKYEAAGVTVIKDVDRKAFRDATAKVYDTYAGWTPGLHAKVKALLAK
ncbi:MAG: C4-dicarboxylate TRAP transporter substrate-binding protein [Alphaproteobacteria bacterium]|nr:C4-dicarboxylate TRAP transporter substrate-binding protein [Alphaproteobacteria bacterium]